MSGRTACAPTSQHQTQKHTQKKQKNSPDAASGAYFQSLLRPELATLRREYETLLYGGEITTVNKDITFNTRAPPGAFASQAFADVFFRTTNCLRADAASCFGASDALHDATHHGLDAIVNRFVDQGVSFAMLPPGEAHPTHPRCVCDSVVGSVWECVSCGCFLFAS